MPRFSFPVPGLRRKKESQPAIISPPLSTKAQKFLGSANLNIDVQAARISDHAVSWDTASNSCISISVSESSFGNDDSGNARTGQVTTAAESRAAFDVTTRQLDEESGIFPTISKNTPGLRDSGLATSCSTFDEHSIVDASSLRRQQSSSTITSFYDKSKVPLVISQQTSNSAMAKGLPYKASSLLDMDGSMAGMSSRGKKMRPSRLDLLQLFPQRKASTTASVMSSSLPLLDNDLVSPSLLSSPEADTSSPSVVSVSPRDSMAGPRSGHRTEKKLQKRSRGSLRHDILNLSNSKHTPPPPTASRGLSEREVSGLENLYEHYERMTFRDLRAQQQNPMASPATVPEIVHESCYDDLFTNRDEHSVRHASRHGNKGIHTRLEERATTSTKSDGLGCGSATGSSSQADYESISSRHTRTSRASKQTTHSLADVDLMQTSVLSLSSSDSEEEDDDGRPRTSVSVPGRPPSIIEETLYDFRNHRPSTSQSASAAKKPKKRPERMVSGILPNPDRLSPLTISAGSSVSASTLGNVRSSIGKSRTSTKSTTAGSTARLLSSSQVSSPRTSRTSLASMHTVNSLTPASYTVHEARAITLVPAQGASYGKSPDGQSGSTSPEDLTPPLSPMSVEFYPRCSYVTESDRGSLHSGHNYGVARVGSSSSRSSSAADVLAVPRQEELLLAALRKKRTRMQEPVDEQDDREPTKRLPTQHPTSELQLSHRPNNNYSSTIEVQLQSIDRGSVSFKDFPLHIEDGIIASTQEHVPEVRIFEDPLDYSIGVPLPIPMPLNMDNSAGPYNQVATSRCLTSSAASSDIKLSSLQKEKIRSSFRQHRSGSIDINIPSEQVDAVDQNSITGDTSDIPRPDSPIEVQLPLPRNRGVRISAVGAPGSWW